MNIRDTQALGLRILFNFSLVTLCLMAMLATLSAIGMSTFGLAIATTLAVLALVCAHLVLVTQAYVPAAVQAERDILNGAAQ